MFLGRSKENSNFSHYNHKAFFVSHIHLLMSLEPLNAKNTMYIVLYTTNVICSFKLKSTLLFRQLKIAYNLNLVQCFFQEKTTNFLSYRYVGFTFLTYCLKL